MMKDTSYSKIPSNNGLCEADCPRGDTCLRRIGYDRQMLFFLRHCI